MIEIWDNQKLQQYACEMRGHLSMEEHLVPNEPAEALEFGKAFHKAIEVWTTHSLREEINPLGELPKIHAKAAAREMYEKNLPPELWEQLNLMGDRRSIDNLYILFEAF